MAHSTNSRAYFHRASMLSLESRMTKNQKRLPSRVRQREAARQGPALGVMPVFIPLHPSPSRRLVFSHSRRLDLAKEVPKLGAEFSFSSSMVWLEAMVSASSLSSASRQQVCFLVWTILRKEGFRMAQEHSLARSSALEQLLVLESPCGLAKLLEFISILRANRFISFIKDVTNCQEKAAMSELILLLTSRTLTQLLSL